MKTKKYFLLFLFIVFCFSDCKKYPDGPWISFYTKQKRVRGEWQVESFTVGGVDSTSRLCCNTYMFGPGMGMNEQFVGLGCSNKGSFGGDWDFTNDKKDLTIHGIPSSNLGETPFITGLQVNWEIQRLTDKQMWLKVNYNGIEYYTKFNKLKDY